jgi:hypothetical protein
MAKQTKQLGFRYERHFDLFAKYQDGTYHSSSWGTEAEARATLERIRPLGIATAIIWDETDQIDVYQRHVSNLRSKRIHYEVAA